jgi:hypothetical protein
MVRVGADPTRSDAELAQAALAAAGITSALAADDAGGAYPFNLTGSLHLLIDEAEGGTCGSSMGSVSLIPSCRKPRSVRRQNPCKSEIY